MADHLSEAGRHALRTTISWPDFLGRVASGKYTLGSVRQTEWYKAGAELEALKHPEPVPPTPQPPTQSLFAGRGAFTTSEPEACARKPCDWIALQADDEGNTTPPSITTARICWWQARPTQEVADEAMRRGIPYIGQAENGDEINRLLALDLKGPKAIVGNAGSWADHDRLLAAERGWDLIQEWYWNAHPWEQSPDAHNYPRFVNVCFGIYSEGEPGGQGYVPQSKTVGEYRAVWHGSFSVWRAEAMTADDWVAFVA